MNPTPNEQADEELDRILHRRMAVYYDAVARGLTPPNKSDFSRTKAALQGLIAKYTKAAVIEELNEARKWATKAESADQVWQQITDRLAELAIPQATTNPGEQK